jgi:hypothetical protein
MVVAANATIVEGGGGGRRQAVAGDSVFTMEVVFASAVGEGLFWVMHLFTVPNPNHQMPLMFGFRLLETVLREAKVPQASNPIVYLHMYSLCPKEIILGMNLTNKVNLILGMNLDNKSKF